MTFLSRLRHPGWRHGVSGIPNPGERACLELVCNPSDDTEVHSTQLTLAPAHPGVLSVALLRDGRQIAQGMSRHSLRVWGAFHPGATLSVGSATSVEVIARTPDGRCLAGPLALTPEQPWLTIRW